MNRPLTDVSMVKRKNYQSISFIDSNVYESCTCSTQSISSQTNREDLSDRYKEILLPIPREDTKRELWSRSVEEYFAAQIKSRLSYNKLMIVLDEKLFVDRP